MPPVPGLVPHIESIDEAFFDDEAPAPPPTAPLAAAVAAPSDVAKFKLPLDESQEVVGLLPLLEEPDI